MAGIDQDNSSMTSVPFHDDPNLINHFGSPMEKQFNQVKERTGFAGPNQEIET